MNAPVPAAAPMRWYQVAEVWLILLLLGSTMAGSIGLVITAIDHPDRHLVVPGDAPRPSHQPPVLQPAVKR